MRPLITLLCALVLFGCSCCNQADAQFIMGPRSSNYRPRPAFNPNAKMDGAQGGQYNAGRLPELPQGPSKLHCWIVVSPNWRNNPLEFKLAQAIANDPRLKQIKAGTFFNFYESSSPLFKESGLIAATGTATPIIVLTNNDGMIRADGSGGIFVNAQSCPQTVAEIVDMLCDGIEQFNPPPVVEGQTNSTPFVRESDWGPGAQATQCGPDDCTPPTITIPNQPSEGTLTPVRPRPRASDVGLLIGASIGLFVVVAGLVVVGVAQPFKPKTQ